MVRARVTRADRGLVSDWSVGSSSGLLLAADNHTRGTGGLMSCQECGAGILTIIMIPSNTKCHHNTVIDSKLAFVKPLLISLIVEQRRTMKY